MGQEAWKALQLPVVDGYNKGTHKACNTTHNMAT